MMKSTYTYIPTKYLTILNLPLFPFLFNSSLRPHLLFVQKFSPSLALSRVRLYSAMSPEGWREKEKKLIDGGKEA
jgi:hypothetical protein